MGNWENSARKNKTIPSEPCCIPQKCLRLDYNYEACQLRSVQILWFTVFSHSRDRLHVTRWKFQMSTGHPVRSQDWTSYQSIELTGHGQAASLERKQRDCVHRLSSSAILLWLGSMDVISDGRSNASTGWQRRQRPFSCSSVSPSWRTPHPPQLAHPASSIAGYHLSLRPPASLRVFIGSVT